MVIKLLGIEETCNTTPNSFGGNKLIRIVNSSTNSSFTVGHLNSNSETIATMTLLPLSEAIIEKAPTDYLASSDDANVLAVAVAYKN